MDSRGSDSATTSASSTVPSSSSADEKPSTPNHASASTSTASSSASSAATHTSRQKLEHAYRKIDWAIMPLMFLCYFLQFLDKVIINYANIMGLSQDLGFKGNDFSWMATAFFIGYAVAELPQGFLIQRFDVTKVLGLNVVMWGITICCTAAARNFAGVAALRTLLGMFEAVITPALILITAQWYTKKQATPRTGLWYCGLGAGQIVGGFLSWAAQHGTEGGSFPSWKIMFVAVGAFNITVGAAVCIFMPSSIRGAKFLTECEKQAVEAALAQDQSGSGKKVFRKEALWEALKDLQVWLLFLNTILIVIPSGIITTFSATLIRSFGYNPKESALLNMPSGVVSIVATIGSTYAIREHFPHWLSICALLIPTMVGAGLMSFHGHDQASALAGIYLINFDVAPLALIYALAGSNTAGYTKRVATSAAVAIAFSIANIIGPQTFQADDAPNYLPAKITVFAVCGGSIVVTMLTRLLYGVRNRRNEKAAERRQDNVERGAIQPDIEDDWTDRTNPAFRYIY